MGVGAIWLIFVVSGDGSVSVFSVVTGSRRTMQISIGPDSV
jgi:hypothetical protein